MTKTITSNKKDALTVFPKNTDCLENMRLIKANNHRLIKAKNHIYQATSIPIYIEDIYFDYSKNWKYTNLVAHPKNEGSHQILTPKEQEFILYGTEEQYQYTIQNIISRLNKQYNTEKRYVKLIKTNDLKLKFEEQLNKTENGLTRDILITLWQEINKDTAINPTTEEIQEILNT